MMESSAELQGEQAVEQWVRERFHLHDCDVNYIGPSGGLLPPHSLRLLSSLGSLGGLGDLRRLRRLDLSDSRPDPDLTRLLDDELHSLDTLVLDSCQLGDATWWPRQLEALTTLSLNKNFLSDLDRLLRHLTSHFPSLTHLSLLGNQLCPHPGFSRESNIDYDHYRRYRLYLLHHLHRHSPRPQPRPRLLFLDDRPVTSAEADEADRHGQFALPDKSRLHNNNKHGRVGLSLNELASDLGGLWGDGRQWLGGALEEARERAKKTTASVASHKKRTVWDMEREDKERRRQQQQQQQLPPTASFFDFVDSSTPTPTPTPTPTSLSTGGAATAPIAAAQHVSVRKPPPSTEPEPEEMRRPQLALAPTPAKATQSSELSAKGESVFGKMKYHYSGKNSEGNRFIRNGDL